MTNDANAVFQDIPRRLSPMQYSSSATAPAILRDLSSTKPTNRTVYSSIIHQYSSGANAFHIHRPTYELGIWSMIVSHLIEAVLITTLGLLLRWENKKRDRIQSQMEGGLEGRDLDSTAFLDLTDRENLKYVLFLIPSCCAEWYEIVHTVC